MKKSTSSKLITMIIVLVLIIFAVFFVVDRYQPQKKYDLIFIPKVIDEDTDFWIALTEGARMAAEEYGVELTIVGGDSEEDIDKQNELIEWAIKEKPDAILVTPCSFSETTVYLQKVLDANIQLSLIDSEIDKDLGINLVATDNYLAGEALGSFARTLFEGEEPVIGIVGHVKDASTAIQREGGVRTGLGSYNADVVEVVFCDSSYKKAYDLTKQMVEDHPNMNLIVGLNEYSAVGAARAVKDLRLTGQIKLVGFDSSLEEIKLMEEGVFQGIVIQKPFNMGYQGVEQAIMRLNGKKVEPYLDSGCKLITPENLYEEENQKLLFPFVK